MAKKFNKTIESLEENPLQEEEILIEKESTFKVGCKVKNIKNNFFYIVYSLPANLNENSKLIVSSLENTDERYVFFKRDLELI